MDGKAKTRPADVALYIVGVIGVVVALVFNNYGDQYFLSTLSWPDGPSRMLRPASIEGKAARNIEARKLAVAGR